jgi:hypothetical protein
MLVLISSLLVVLPVLLLLEMAMDTRNPNTRRVLPDMKAGTG